MSTPPLYIVVALAIALAALAAAEAAWRFATVPRRRPAVRVGAASAALLAAAISAVVACLHLAGRLGVEQLWFRAPAFYVAAAILLLAVAAWFRIVDRPLLRFGIPAAGLAVAALAAIVIRADGRSTPLTMLLPSLRRAAPELTWTTVSGQPGSIYDLGARWCW